MQKLIKINTDHYIIVDDSKIEVDDWYIDDAKQIRKSVVSDEVYWQHRPYNREYMKITHSTEPLDKSLFFTNKVWGCERLSLGEVKELIGEVDVEKKAETKYPKSEFWVGSNPSRLYDENAKDRRCFLEGYNQAIEDNKDKKYTEEDLRRAFFNGGNMKEIEEFNSFIQSLQPKTKWEVEVVDGKLKLK